MILVTIGTADHQFTRLIKEIDRIAGTIDEKVIMQIGHTEYRPQNAEYFRFTSREEMEKLYERARIIVSHAGIGAIITTLRYSKPIIVVPRMKKYREHWDDHQLQIADEWGKEGKVTVVYDANKLEKALAEVDINPPSLTGDKRLVTALKEYLSNLEES